MPTTKLEIGLKFFDEENNKLIQAIEHLVIFSNCANLEWQFTMINGLLTILVDIKDAECVFYTKPTFIWPNTFCVCTFGESITNFLYFYIYTDL